MATFFGEVVFSSSRAVDDEDEEGECLENEELKLQLHDDTLAGSEKLQCKHLIVTMRRPANALADCYILNQEKETVGTFQYCIKKNDPAGDEERSTPSKKEEPSCLYRLKQHHEVLVCQCRDTWSSKTWYDFNQQLFNVLDQSVLSQVTILDSCSGSDYKTEQMSDISYPLLRCLKSNSFTRAPSCPYLESPNTISGLGASVLYHCQITNIPAVLYVVYTESLFIDTDTVLAFRPVLEKDFKSFTQVEKKCDERLKLLLSKPSHLDSLYT